MLVSHRMYVNIHQACKFILYEGTLMDPVKRNHKCVFVITVKPCQETKTKSHPGNNSIRFTF